MKPYDIGLYNLCTEFLHKQAVVVITSEGVCKHDIQINELFTVYTDLAEMALLASRDLMTAKTILVGFNLRQDILNGLRVLFLTN